MYALAPDQKKHQANNLHLKKKCPLLLKREGRHLQPPKANRLPDAPSNLQVLIENTTYDLVRQCPVHWFQNTSSHWTVLNFLTGILHHYHTGRKSEQVVSPFGSPASGQLHAPALNSKEKSVGSTVLSVNDLGKAQAISEHTPNNTAPASRTGESVAQHSTQQSWWVFTHT